MSEPINKKLALNLIELLSALQIAYFASNKSFPDYILEDIADNLDELRIIVLGE